MWTQKLFKITNKFQNPIRQNFKHIKALESLLDLPLETFHSVIIFVRGSAFKTKMPEYVTYAGQYIAYIKSKNKLMLSTSEVETVCSTISRGRLTPSLKTNREHVKNVQQRLDPDAPRLCPKCGADMIKRTVKSGDKVGNVFWGCSSFPKCRAIQNIT